MPGYAKTVSVRIAPDSSSPTCRPTIVDTGSSAFRSTCRMSTMRGARPFARAVRM